MDEFKKKLKIRVSAIALFVIVYAVVNASVHIFGAERSSGLFSGIIDGFGGGMLTAMVLLCVAVSLRYNRAMKNDTELQKLYNAEHDERKLFIKQKCGGDIIVPLSIVIIAAATVAAYFNVTVFITLMCTAFFQLLTCCCLKLYYSRKY